MQLFINTDYTFTEQRYMRMVLFSGPSFMMRGIMIHIVSIEHTSYKAYAFSVAYILFWTIIIAMMVIQQSILSVTMPDWDCAMYACMFLLPFLCIGWPDCIVYCKLQRSWPDCGATPQKRSWCEPSNKGEASMFVPHTVIISIFTMESVW